MSHRTSAILSVALSAVLLAGPAGCSQVTRENYDSVRTGMAVEEVKKILGEPAEASSGGVQVMGVGGSAATMTWKSGDKSISITFVNDKVVQKDMSNL